MFRIQQQILALSGFSPAVYLGFADDYIRAVETTEIATLAEYRNLIPRTISPCSSPSLDGLNKPLSEEEMMHYLRMFNH
ncbi:hypothetical protein KSC_071330 [Ktedonobacter sp. SOSP1-52]|uniref:hypothetical protein n=1 Tax=Ktedonobacter sp. SOSP1-52 TaxID=2778366 RepID=UPI001914DED9|nr:hypothetical protein [Ktedonobacter sp. SOSP1-52]GHO68241.1 hypothetical protein KSC_071330 [Ktedonobacter sp. SOSP1-52]